MWWHFNTQALLLKTTGADNDCSLGGAGHLTGKSENKKGHLNAALARGGGNLNDPVFKSSNARALPG